MKINGQTKIIGFLGSTYKTSKMYALYNAAFKSLDLNYVYVPLVVTDLKKAVDGIRNLGIHAAGVTVPYKIDIIKYLDVLDDNARRIGAVNGLLNISGKLEGFNTDGIGCVKAIKEQNIKINNKKIIILGSGGAAKSISVSLQDEGGLVTVLNRENMPKLKNEIQNSHLLINATTVGMTPKINQSLVPENLLFQSLAVMDIITNPRDTKLLKDAENKGCQTIYGERMLLWQAVEKFKLFTGKDSPVKIMEEALC